VLPLSPDRIRFYLDFIQDPISGASITFDNDTRSFRNTLSGNYKISDGIPVLLPASYQTTETIGFNYADHYEKDAVCFDYFEEYEDAASRFEQKRLHEFILSRLPVNTSVLLDVGCGNAWAAEACLPKNITVVSADIALTNPLKALQKLPVAHHYGLVADALHLPVQPEKFDAIIAAEIMEHVTDPAGFIQNLYRALKKGGRLIITTPYHEKLEYSLCIHCNKPTPRHAHLHSFHEKNVKGFMPDGSCYKMTIFMNKYLLKLKTHVFLQYMPYTFWKKTDAIAEWFRPSPLRLCIEIEKPL
jgi:SAM-dependent methyltransferase